MGSSPTNEQTLLQPMHNPLPTSNMTDRIFDKDKMENTSDQADCWTKTE